jgi:16S rRNA (cytosine967-C5)-methyltransferase
MKNRDFNNPRLAAVKAIAEVLDQGKNLADAKSLDLPEDSRDKALAKHLVYGVMRWRSALEWIASGLLKRPLKQRDQDIQRLLLIGILQLWQEQAAEHAAVHETAECARTLGKPWAVAVINAVLRRFQRERQAWLIKLESEPARYAHPDWLLQSLQQDWPEQWQDIVRANNRQAAMWLRVNRAAMMREEAMQRLEAAGFSVTAHPVAADAIRVEPAAQVSDIPGFTEGGISVQDPAAQLAVDLLDVQPGQRVLDACAAPGGKTCHILERTPGACLTAIDLDEARLERLRENFRRQGFECRLVAADATAPEDWWDGTPFRRILLDTPCSATGVIRRHPEIKWLRQAAQVSAAVRLQARLLLRLWPLLEAGGMLVYATCSVLKDENSRQISDFVSQHKDAEIVDMDFEWGQAQSIGRQILPGELDMDGFFYARLRKNP